MIIEKTLKPEYMPDPPQPKKEVIEGLKKEVEKIEGHTKSAEAPEPIKEIAKKLDKEVGKIKAGLAFPKTIYGSNRKQAIGIRLDPEIIAYFQEDGHGWQTRMNDVLREYIASQNLKLRKD